MAVLWVGFKVADPHIKYWQLKDEMNQAARFASTLSDEEIRRRIVAEVRRLNLPEQAEQVGVHRQPGRSVVIWLEYTVTVDLPKFDQEFTFRPVAEAPL